MSLQFSELVKDPECAVLASSATLINELGEEIGTRDFNDSFEAILRKSRWKTAIMHPTVMFRRDVIIELGGYSNEAVNVEDYELWLRVLARHKIRARPEHLLRYRLHGGQVTQSKSITKPAALAVRKTRIALAQARGESILGARIRHVIWSTRQKIRELMLH